MWITSIFSTSFIPVFHIVIPVTNPLFKGLKTGFQLIHSPYYYYYNKLYIISENK